MKRRILIFSVAYHPAIGGAELAVRNITDRLLHYEFDLITCALKPGHPAREKIGNVNVYRVGFGSRLGRLLYPVLAYRLGAKLHRKNPYQIVWGIMAAYGAAAALMFKNKFKVKFLLTLQEGDSIEHIHSRVYGFRKFWQKAFKGADRIQAISNFLATWARWEGATCEIDVVPNGVDTEKFQFPISNFQSISNSKIFKIITVSRLVAKNGIDILIKAAEELKTLIPDSRFVIQILGGGMDEKKLKKLATDLKVEDVVEFKGEISPSEVPQYLAQAHVFVRPSRSEGLGSAFLEAMAAGLAVVGTSVGGIPDFLIDHKTGLFCEMNDPKDLAEKILLLFKDEELRREIGRNAEALVLERYTWDHVVEQMDNSFQKLI
ncbi:MAG: glycosyltransferase family 4 protein [bacterium]|nr:glycosyltransferase family 4 protein [bacterium]